MEMDLTCESEHLRYTCSPSSRITNVMRKTGTVVRVVSEHDNAASSTKNRDECQRVTVLGSLKRVEKARQLLRGDPPLEFALSCCADRIDCLGQQLLVAHFTTIFGITLSFNLITEDACYQVCFHGHRRHYDQIKEAALHFCHITHTSAESVEAEIKTSYEHWCLIRNKSQWIEDQSGAQLRCPVENHTTLVRGSIDSLFQARELITGLTPILLQFTVASNGIDRICRIARLMDLHVSSRLVDGVDSYVKLSLLTYEWNTRFMYELWRMAANFDAHHTVIPEHPKSWSSDKSGPFFIKIVETLQLNHRLHDNSILNDKHSGSVDTNDFTALRSPERSPVSILPKLSNLGITQSLVDTEAPLNAEEFDPLSDQSFSPTTLSRLDTLTVANAEDFLNPNSLLSPSPSLSPDLGIHSNETRNAGSIRPQEAFELTEILKSIGLAHFSEMFIKKGIREKCVFASLTNDDLTCMGIKSSKARKILLSTIRDIREHLAIESNNNIFQVSPLVLEL